MLKTSRQPGHHSFFALGPQALRHHLSMILPFNTRNFIDRLLNRYILLLPITPKCSKLISTKKNKTLAVIFKLIFGLGK